MTARIRGTSLVLALFLVVAFVSAATASAGAHGRGSRGRSPADFCFWSSSGWPTDGGLVRGPLVGDVDGDGIPDQVTAVASRTAEGSCRYHLSVRTARGRFTAPLPVGPEQVDFQISLGPWMLFRLAGVRGQVVLVQTNKGASTGFGAMFVLQGSTLRRLTFEDDRRNLRFVGDVSQGGSASYGDGVDCLAGSPRTIVKSDYQEIGRTSFFLVTQRYYRLIGSTFFLFGEGHLVVLDSELGRFRAFRSLSPFPSCPRVGP